MINECFCDFREMGVAEHQERQLAAEAKSRGGMAGVNGVMQQDGGHHELSLWSPPQEQPQALPKQAACG